MAELEESQSPSSRRIAKNALMLYIRMFLSMIVGLYTSRVVLNTLGVEDYGIYGVVGGIVAMMGFLNASMSGATSRFITFELGKGNQQRLNDTFSSAMIVHIGIALVVLIAAETIGLWFLNNKLVIPEGRMEAAHWVYQLSIASAMLGITQVPYNACIIAHERMGVYAYIEILNVTLKLLIVYLLTIGDFDKLKLYAVLTFIVSIIVLMTYRIYSMRKFSECHFHWVWKKEILRPLLSFSGWDLYGNMCVTARQQGTNFLINMFFGVALNAASTIATNIAGIVQGLATNITQAYRPNIIKCFANEQYSSMQSSMNNCIKFMLLFLGVASIPLHVDMPFYINLWLNYVPIYSDIFCKILLVNTIPLSISVVLSIGIHATGHIKKLSIITGTIYLLNVPILYLLLYLNPKPEYAYYSFLGTMAIATIINTMIFNKLIPQISLIKYYTDISKVLIILGINFSLCNFIAKISPEPIRYFYVIICDLFFSGTLTYLVLLNKNQKKQILKYMRHKLHFQD